MSRKEDLLKGANEVQQKIIKNIYGKFAVWATAGSGKTRSIVHRTAYMIESGVPANQILMFTFTRKAAEEMETRIKKLIGAKAKGITVSTYHSFCGKLLRRYAKVIGLQSNFTIYDDDDAMSALKIIVENNMELFDLDIKQLRSGISSFKEQLISPIEAMKNHSNTVIQKKIAVAYQEYYNYLRKSNALDFDDLQYFAVKALQHSQTMREQVNSQYRYIISDEHQDASYSNLILISLLAGPDPDKWNLCVVGDIDQSKL